MSKWFIFDRLGLNREKEYLMEQFDLLVLGFGKAGKTLAGKLAAAGQKVALVEENPAMFGGTCINIGCIPTKTLLVAAD